MDIIFEEQGCWQWSFSSLQGLTSPWGRSWTHRLWDRVGLWVHQPRGGLLTSGFSGSIHCDFDGSVVGGDLWWICEDGDGESEALPCWDLKQNKKEWGDDLNHPSGNRWLVMAVQPSDWRGGWASHSYWVSSGLALLSLWHCEVWPFT
jgi:hypothetical protein